MNIFDDLKYMSKPKNIRLLSEKFFQRMIENFFFSMFKYKSFPDSMPQEILERIFIYNGCIAGLKLTDAEASKYNSGMYAGNSVAAPAQPAEDPDFYGLGSEFIVTSANGYCKTFKPNEIAIGWNNSSYSSCRVIIYHCAHDIYEALSALRAGIKYTKQHPVYKAIDDKERAVMQELWNKVQNEDDQLTVTSYNIMEAMLQEAGGNDNRVINLTDPILADKLQYVSKVIDDYMRWFLGLYGQTIQGNGKMAQQSVAEVNGQTSSSFILPNDMLYQRRKWLEKLKALEIVPEDAEIDFSTAWKVEEVKYEKEADIDENGNVEEVEQTDIETETETDTETETEKEGEENE